MYCLSQFCAICLKKAQKYRSLISSSSKSFQCFEKLKFCSYDFEWLPDYITLYICNECYDTIKVISKFRKTCARNSAIMKGYHFKLLHGVTETACSSEQIDQVFFKQETEDIVEYLENEYQNDDYEQKDEMNHDDERCLETVIEKVEFSVKEEGNSSNFGEFSVDMNQNTEPTMLTGLNQNPETDYTAVCTTENAHIQNGDITCDNFRTKEEIDDIKREIVDEQCSPDDKIKFNYNSTRRTYAYRIGVEDAKLEKNSNPENRYSCTICKETFGHRAMLKRHWASHGEKHLTCFLCEKKFTNIELVNKHILTHSSDSIYLCKFCGKKFIAIDTLNQHILTHKGEPLATDCDATSRLQLSFPCNQCDRRFSNQEKLNVHLTCHSNDDLDTCPLCKKSFAKNYLKKHIETHTGEKPYKCEVCKKRFSIRNNWKIHVRTHSGEKRFKCELCHEGFNRKYQIDIHMHNHTGIRPHKCGICDKRFKSDAYLKKHVFYHTGLKPYKCSFCGKTFKLKTSLKDHLVSHSGKKPYTCSVCNKTYSLKDSLRKHVPTHDERS